MSNSFYVTNAMAATCYDVIVDFRYDNKEKENEERTVSFWNV